MEKEKNRKEKIRNGFRACLEGELELLEEASKTGEGFDSENYFDVFRVAKKMLYLPEKEIKKYETEYSIIVSSYWKNIRKKDRLK